MKPVFEALRRHFPAGIFFVILLSMKKCIFKTPILELIFWCIGLAGLWWMDPARDHIGLCPLYHLGIAWCPGCGLGRSIAFLMKGDLSASWNLHPLGGFALLVISSRIFEISRKNLNFFMVKEQLGNAKKS